MKERKNRQKSRAGRPFPARQERMDFCGISDRRRPRHPSGTKTVLFDVDGNVVASKTIEYPLYQEKNGWAEQDPLDWWNAAADTIRAVVTESGVNNADIKGLGISGQMHGLVMLDRDGNVLRRSIIWCDQRTAKECEEITARVGAKRLIEITANPALTGFTASKILWVRNNEPEIYEKCAHILLPKDYVRYMLTGDFATEVSDASGMQLLDVPNRCWSDEVLEKLEIDKALLPKVYESPEITGVISEEAAKRTGLLAGTIVVGGAGDNAGRGRRHRRRRGRQGVHDDRHLRRRFRRTPTRSRSTRRAACTRSAARCRAPGT